ncbi:MAG TPA: efflux RND transporter periplasmic adaptor subunit [Verrucomicrobiae bacterium]|nr:efflux RND transporter periplasmic adaptor subunit [Verrucomicrobiae bacterium]
MANKKSGWGRWIGTLIVLGGLIAAGVWYFKRGKEAPQYQTAAVTRGDLLQVVTATGNLNPVVNVQVGSQISGRIKQIYVDFNSNVTSNQLIAQIDPSTYQVAVLRAEAQLSNSIANLTLTKVQAERADSLFANNLIPAADHDTAMAQLQQAEAEVRSSQANLASANVDLSRCSIVAPVDGVVISRNVDVGQTVAASFNTPTLFIIANDLSKMQIGALVSEADIGGVQTNQNVNFTVDAYPDRTFRGKVSQIRYGAVTNQNVVNYSAIIEVNNEDLKLLPGMTANVSIIIQQRDDVVKVPNAALRFRPPEGAIPETKAGAPSGPGGNRGPRMGGRPGGNRPSNSAAGHTGKRTVYILENKDSDAPKLKPVQITTGITDGIATEVIDGLKEGDEVVTAVIASDDSDSGPANPFGGGGRRGRRL